MLKIMGMKAEGMPVVISLLPIALLGCWGWSRLDCFSAQPDEPLAVRAYYPLSSVGKRTQLVVPEDADIELKDDPIRTVRLDPDGEVNGLAEWTIIPRAESESIKLAFRHLGQSAQHEISVGGNLYAAPLNLQEGKFMATETRLKQAKFLGILPGIPQIMLPPWLVAYFLIAVPFVPITRKLLRVY